MDELVSIVMAVYNGEKHLRQQMQSLQTQDYRSLEIILLDDDSSDGSWQIVQTIAAEDPRVKLFRNSHNLGITANFLKGLSIAKGGYICFCDQDDVWLPDKIALLKLFIGSDPRNMLAYSDLEVCDEDLNRLQPSFWKISGVCPSSGQLNEKVFLRNISPGCSMMFRREVREAMGRFSGSVPFMHDHLAWILAAGLGRIVFSREKLVKYRQHDQNNIGTAQRPPASKEFRAQRLREQIECFRQKDLQLPSLDLGRLERFAEASLRRSAARRPEFLPYYLYLRRDVLQDKLLGVMEWLT